MKKNAICLTLASVAVGSVLTLGASSASAANMTLTQAVNDFLLYTSVNDTSITNGCSINWSTREGHTKGACFFIEILKHGNGYSTDYNALNSTDIFNMWSYNSPPSSVLFDKVDASPAPGGAAPVPETYFRKISSLGQVQANDIMVIDNFNGYSGHVLIVTGPATLVSPQYSPVWSGTLQYALPIADSTDSKHGCNPAYPDSRWSGDCTNGYPVNNGQGAGTGYIRIYTDLVTGNIIGYTWSVGPTNSAYYYPNSTSSIGHPFRFGRLTNLPAPQPAPPPPPPPPPVGTDT